MQERRRHSRNELPTDYVETLYRRHFQGALVRSGASLVMWVFALAAYLLNIIGINNFTGVTFSVLYLILMNPPTLLLLKHIHMRSYEYGSLLINFLEILGYTAIIYFLGGIEATFLTPIYAALITYVGVVAPRSVTYTIAILCSAAFSFVVVSEYFGLLPRQSIDPLFNPPWLIRATYLSVVIGLLLIVAYIASVTSDILKRNRNRLREQNVELMEKTASLEAADMKLRTAHQELETRVEERTAELTDAIDQLRIEIGKRERIADALRESEERYRTLVENASDLVYVMDATGNVIFVNPSGLRVTGYEEKEVIGKHYSTLVHPDMRDEAIKFFSRQFMKRIKNTYSEYPILTKGGHEVWLGQNTQLIMEDSHVIGFQSVSRDITERKQAEGALRKSEQGARRLAQENALVAEMGRIIGSTLNIEEVFEHFSNAVAKLVPFDRIQINLGGLQEDDSYVRYVAGIDVPNRMAGEYVPLTGTATAECMRTRSSLLLQPKDGKEIEELGVRFPRLLPNLEAGMRSVILVPLIAEDKTIGVLSLRSVKTKAYADQDVRLAESIASQIAGAVANAQLYIERTQTEEAARRSAEEAKRLAQENALVAEMGRIIGSTLNIDEVFEHFSNAVAKLVPFDRIVVNLYDSQKGTSLLRYVAGLEVPTRRVGDPLPLAGTITAECIRTKASLLVQPTDVKEIEERVGKFPGLLPTFEAGIRSIIMVPMIAEDQIIGVLSLRSVKTKAYTDQDMRLAESIASQIAGAVANAQLFAERKRSEEERKSLQERLQRAEKMEALGQLAGGVAHDLNNVLGVLSGYSELLLEEVPEGSLSRDYVEKILQSTEKGAAIIQDLLTLARRGVTVSNVININSVVSDFLTTPVFEKLQGYHPRVTFRTECDPNLLNIKGSLVHLEKTLMNLVSNAAESISGEGEVTIRTESLYLDKPLRGYDEVKEGDYAVLTVSDTGMGIPVESREKIFEPFYTKKAMGRSGTGLGLAIVWGTVKDHDGYIDVRTEVGAGTTFTLYFPVTREELIAQQQKVPIERYMSKGESVLVVDDIAEQRDVATSLLTRLGYQVHVVSSGEKAVEYLKGNKADILVLDMIMAPGMDGLETYQRVLEINPKQKAIIVSGFSETERVKATQEFGAGAYIKKPYIMEKIGVAIRDELGRK